MSTQIERWEQALEEFSKENQSLEDCVSSFFDILDSKEESDSGREFSPVYISSCRVWSSAKLKILLDKMRKLSKSRPEITSIRNQ